MREALNRLQQLDEPRHYSVTLNRTDEIDPEAILSRIVYHHPTYTHNALAAQTRLGEIQGGARTHYCGAWQGFGTHEDGLSSALAVARALEIDW